ncbi:DNA polymerase Y family protein [Pelosinus propionicus]|uniref:DNA polymerase Y family protein n=1 Tax=Pelosinus propionicus TaxID=380084 RepID=UPI002481D386|nr:DNA polymerase IV [Pelosinus propionicus]
MREAKQKCPGLVLVRADFQKYLRFSRLARKIYADYTNQIEPFGIDEAWLDVTGTEQIFGTGQDIANQIRQRLQDELGLTGSVGVSYNKIFAKLGSDMNKPNATTVITADNFQDKVWPLPVGELLYVGRSTRRKFQNRAIYTIGDLANRDIQSLRLLLGIWGETLHGFANGFDLEPVRLTGESSIIKSVGNSTTTPRDLVNNQDVKLIIYVLAESVAARLRKHGFKCKTISISVRGNDLISFERQGKLSGPTFLSNDIANKAMELFKTNYRWETPIRSLGVRGSDLVTADRHVQLDLFDNSNLDAEILASTVDTLHKRFGHYSVQRCAMLLDRHLTGFNPEQDHVIHPISYFK